jgi:hypothetical protein
MLLSGEVDGRGVVSRGAASSEAEFDIHSGGGGGGGGATTRLV